MREPEVEACHVLRRMSQDKTGLLLAYVVLTEPGLLKQLEERLRHKLSPDERPALYVVVPALPLAADGAVDEVALAALEVIDDDLLKKWENDLQADPRIEQVAVVAETKHLRQSWLDIDALCPQASAPTQIGASQRLAVTARPDPMHISDAPPSISHGDALRSTATDPVTLRDLLVRAAGAAERKAVVYVESDGSETVQPYPQLLDEATRLLTGLRRLGLQPQDRIIFQLDRASDFIPAFWASILGGMIPVPASIPPAYEPDNSGVHKLHEAWKLLGSPVILTCASLAASVKSVAEALHLDGFRVEVVDELRHHAPAPNHYQAQPQAATLYLLTSGSTGVPKCVMLSHRNLLSMLAGLVQMNGFTRHDTTLNWLPLDHVGSIVFLSLMGVLLQARQVHIPTDVILCEPLRLLNAIEHYRASVSWAPNFAFGLILERCQHAPERRWNLSSMGCLVNAGEAVVAETMQTFLDVFCPQGLPRDAIQPAFGMSETCSGITWSQGFSPAEMTPDMPYVNVGRPIPGASVRIVDDQGNVVDEGAIGHLQVAGPSVFSGYYGNEAATRERFSDGWFSTGDLGCLRHGALFITGREQDVIVINGVNYYSYEIETLAERVDGVTLSFTAAVAVSDGAGSDGEWALFFHPEAFDDASLLRLVRAIRNALVQHGGIRPTHLIPLEKSAIPKTAIGKIQRAALAQAFEAGAFDAIRRRMDVLTGAAKPMPDWFFRKIWRRLMLSMSQPTAGAVTLVLTDRAGLGEALADIGMSQEERCIQVSAGTDFARLTPHRYHLDTTQKAHYRRLFESLENDGIRVDRIVHLLGYDVVVEPIRGMAEIGRILDNGIYSLLFTVQALRSVQGDQHPVSLMVVSSFAQHVRPQDRLTVGKATLSGFLKSLSLECPWLTCLHLDLEPGPPHVLADIVRVEETVVWHEPEVAYRDGERWVPRLENANLAAAPTQAPPFRQGGFYVISGGLGGIGHVIARHLLQQYRAHLLLLGRTELDTSGSTHKHSVYKALQDLPGQVAYEGVDVCDVPKLKQVVHEAARRWGGQLDGIIHLAGATLERWLLEETRAQMAETLQAKVFGTWALQQLLGDWPDIPFISFSSVNGLFGGVGVGAYAAANSFLDAFGHEQAVQRPGRYYGLSWSFWDNVGMSRGYQGHDAVRARGYHVIDPEQGLNAFQAAMGHAAPGLYIGLDPTKRHIRRWVEAPPETMRQLRAYYTVSADQNVVDFADLTIPDRFGTPSTCEGVVLEAMPLDADGAMERDALLAMASSQPAATVAPRTETERQIVAIWRELLASPPTGIESNFFELGGDSLLGAQMIARLHDVFKAELPLQTFFRYPTVVGLAAALMQQEARPGHIEAIAQVHASIEQMTPEQVRALLDAKRQG
uniref:Nonribosomal peptide synthetase n=1 Tax=uncultured Candidatus Entotheonella sp. TaxID=312019 RepID=A0A1L7NR19_9BACT|nr:nonribosomal peptide synthetase [uncultured Candidatus Entotheonella sp.]